MDSFPPTSKTLPTGTVTFLFIAPQAQDLQASRPIMPNKLQELAKTRNELCNWHPGALIGDVIILFIHLFRK